jgi:hypothetical protein
MAELSNPNYDPGFLNSPGKGQSPSNPLAPIYIQSLGVVSDLSVYQNIFSAGSVNSDVGFTLGLDNFFSKVGFQVSPPGMFQSPIMFEQNVTFSQNVLIGGVIIMGGQAFKPTTIQADSGTHLVLAAY